VTYLDCAELVVDSGGRCQGGRGRQGGSSLVVVALGVAHKVD